MKENNGRRMADREKSKKVDGEIPSANGLDQVGGGLWVPKSPPKHLLGLFLLETT